MDYETCGDLDLGKNPKIRVGGSDPAKRDVVHLLLEGVTERTEVCGHTSIDIQICMRKLEGEELYACVICLDHKVLEAC